MLKTYLTCTVMLCALVGVKSVDAQCKHQSVNRQSSSCQSTQMISTGLNHQADDIVDTAVKAGSFKTLVAAAKAAGLVDALKGDGPITVFAPTDDAFAKLPAGTVEALLKPENKSKLVSILKYHVINGKVTAADVVKLSKAPTLQGTNVRIKIDGSNVMVGNAKVIKTDIMCSNGVIHVVDSVILPSERKKMQGKNIVETADAAGSFKTLLAAAQAAGLAEALSGKGPLTVFAPTDEAFAKIPEDTIKSLLQPENKDQLAAILKFHVIGDLVLAEDVVEMTSAQTLLGASAPINVSDSGVTIAGANVIKTDIMCGNGVIHVIDTVMMPPKRQNIIDTAVGAGQFKTLAAAIEAAGLAGALNGDGPFTVFAPTDAAFAKLPKGTVESLLKPENKAKLAAILKYHVVSGRVMAADVLKLKNAETLQGSSVSIKTSDKGVMIDNANVVKTDIDCTNGVIHVVDSVILPH